MPEPERAARTTPAADGLIAIDETRTYQVHGAFTESMVGVRKDGAGIPLVRADLTGKWWRGADDTPVLMMSPTTAREWGALLIEGAGAAERDVAIFERRRRRSAS
ncbi:MAG: hypothetical protein LC798_16990 [Chloroflexi bacterium]|nr:hypothetical protein [Chloroflexota bacterium]